jgi:hypothetical protein
VLVLGVEVSADLQATWREWLAPEVQPFFVDSLRPWPRSTPGPGALPREVSDTFAAWRVDRSLETLWLDEASFLAMSRPERGALVKAQIQHRRGAVASVRRWSDVLDPATLRSQGDGWRFVWWPSLVARNPRDVLTRVVSRGPSGTEPDGLTSQHREVAGATWNRCADALPKARRVAGSFPTSSGPNCFSTVMSAAGVEDVAETFTSLGPFLAWLESACTKGGRDDAIGTVLVWRNSDGLPVHAAVTIGDGWILEKASGEWWTPIAVRPVADVIRANRQRGQRLERHHIK